MNMIILCNNTRLNVGKENPFEIIPQVGDVIQINALNIDNSIVEGKQYIVKKRTLVSHLLQKFYVYQDSQCIIHVEEYHDDNEETLVDAFNRITGNDTKR